MGWVVFGVVAIGAIWDALLHGGYGWIWNILNVGWFWTAFWIVLVLFAVSRLEDEYLRWCMWRDRSMRDDRWRELDS